MKELKKYIDYYKGRTIFIAGNGIELMSVDPHLFKDEVVIGCNNAHLWKRDCDFFIAGHVIFPMLWEHQANVKEACVFHGIPQDIQIKNVIVNHARTVSTDTLFFKKDSDVLVGSNMVGFSATHLALILGAANIVYMGFDSCYPYHFYDFEPYHSKLWWHVQALKPLYKDNPVLTKEIDEFEKKHIPPAGNAMGYILEHYDYNKNQFRRLFHILRKTYKIGIYATQQVSITVRAGAEFKPLNELPC